MFFIWERWELCGSTSMKALPPRHPECVSTLPWGVRVVFAHATACCPRAFRESIQPLMWRSPHITAGTLSHDSVKSLFLLCLASLHLSPRSSVNRYLCMRPCPSSDQPKGHFTLLWPTSWCQFLWAIRTLSFKWGRDEMARQSTYLHLYL